MLVEAFDWISSRGLKPATGPLVQNSDLVLFFGARSALERPEAYQAIRDQFPSAHVVGCSTGGQFIRGTIEDERLLGVCVKLERSHCKVASQSIAGAIESQACGAALGTTLTAPDLRAILVISDGLAVNGSALVAGLTETVGRDVVISGGLAGDGAQFETTLVAADCAPMPNMVAAIGFYGDALEIATGSAGGWDTFGPHRMITRSEGNVLFELDGKPALDLYERYLGPEDVEGLPGTALLFPLRINDPRAPGRDVMRTVLAVDRVARSMTFAGDMPQGWTAQLMRGSFDRLAEGAGEAARQAQQGTGSAQGLSVLVSCIGRRLLMGQRSIDEVEAAAEAIARQHAMIGFYSYGEIAPHAQSGFCQLHNQTMTVFSVSEHIGSA